MSDRARTRGTRLWSSHRVSELVRRSSCGARKQLAPLSEKKGAHCKKNGFPASPIPACAPDIVQDFLANAECRDVPRLELIRNMDRASVLLDIGVANMEAVCAENTKGRILRTGSIPHGIDGGCLTLDPDRRRDRDQLWRCRLSRSSLLRLFLSSSNANATTPTDRDNRHRLYPFSVFLCFFVCVCIGPLCPTFELEQPVSFKQECVPSCCRSCHVTFKNTFLFCFLFFWDFFWVSSFFFVLFNYLTI